MQGKLWLAMLPLAVALAAPAADAAISDGWITAKTKIALLTTSGVSSRDINVDTVDGRVTLHGTVRSAEEKAKVEQEARKVQGVREVKNLLQVVPGARQEAVKASDAEIEERVERALRDDRALGGSKVSVESVHDGIVLLGGSTPSVSDHLRALETASSVPGVRQVTSEIESPVRLSDEILREVGFDGGRIAALRTKGLVA